MAQEHRPRTEQPEPPELGMGSGTDRGNGPEKPLQPENREIWAKYIEPEFGLAMGEGWRSGAGRCYWGQDGFGDCKAWYPAMPRPTLSRTNSAISEISCWRYGDDPMHGVMPHNPSLRARDRHLRMTFETACM